MTKLLPCPFCGGEAVEKKTGTPGNRKFEVVCTECGCKTFKTVASPCHIEAWNKRPHPQAYCRSCRHFGIDGKPGCSKFGFAEESMKDGKGFCYWGERA